MRRSSSRSTDDGVGGADPSLGSGLEGLVDRVETLDGSLEIVSPPGGGTRIRATIPLTARDLGGRAGIVTALDPSTAKVDR